MDGVYWRWRGDGLVPVGAGDGAVARRHAGLAAAAAGGGEERDRGREMRCQA